MPMPPILPALNWFNIFQSGKTFLEWLTDAEDGRQRETMQNLLSQQPLAQHHEALLRALPRPVHVVVIAEDWCGDVVRHVPVLERLCEAGTNLRVRYITRAQYPNVFIRFLTNGGEAIPKFIFLNDKFTECGNWGPMPNDCREILARGKALGDIPAARKRIAAIYEADATRQSAVTDILHLIDVASTMHI